MDGFLHDLRYALRLFAKSPGITGAAVLALALGIGANTVIFSLVNGVLLRPLPGVGDPDNLVTLERTQNGKKSSAAYPDYVDYRDHNSSFVGLAAHCGTPLSFNEGAPEHLRGDLVSGNYFSVLGATPAFGRLIEPEDDDQPGAHAVAVLGHAFWLRAFGASPEVVGQGIKLNGLDFTIVGIASADFYGTETGGSYDVWIPIKMQAQAMPRTLGRHWFNDRSAGWLSIFGRLKAGVSIPQAEAELATISRGLEQSYPDSNSGRRVSVHQGLGLDSEDRASLRGLLTILLVSVMLLLLIACSNVSILLLLKATARRREIAVKQALGATRGRLIRQLLTEGLVLSVIAGGLGLLLAPWTAQLVLVFQQPAYGLRGVNISPDLKVLTFTAVVSLVTALLFGLAPALQASRVDLVTSLKDGAPSFGRRKSRMQGNLVIAQVAFSLVLVIGAGLAVKTMREALSMDKGFDSENMVLMSMDLTIRGYSESKGQAFYEELLHRVDALPGIISSSLAKTVPPNDWSDRLSVFLPGDEPPPEVLRTRDDLGLRVDANRIAPNYFRTLGVPMIQGREFTDRDRVGTTKVAIINQKLANRLWPGQNAVGQLLSVPFWHEPRPPVQIVGVARDTKHRSLLAEMPMLIYLPELQAYDGRATLVARTSGDPKKLIPAIREEVAALDKDLTLQAVKTMTEQIEGTLWQQRTAAGLIGAFGVLALGLSTIGIYGVIAHSVAQRTREIGIRMALGAGTHAVQRMILRQGLVLALTGILIGLAAAFALTRLMSSLLYGVSPTDPFTFVISSVLLIGVALGACLVPARRATRIDPMIALRCE
ncbi:MAG TPA: ABC transporter permease [Pyrinomonadaceae bacterium]|jgi:predicted permease|nr:ABC transporter permease [Pyrinomonadaceae bacterium]